MLEITSTFFYAKIIEAYTYVGKKNGTLLTYVMVLAHEEVTKHIFVLVPREKAIDWTPLDYIFGVSKYVDDSRMAGEDGPTIDFEIYLEDKIGLRESSGLGKMLSKDYELFTGLDSSKLAHRLVMTMNRTALKYSAAAKAKYLERGATFPSTPALTPAAVTPSINLSESKLDENLLMQYKGELGWIALKGDPRIAVATRSVQATTVPTAGSDRAIARVYSFLERPAWQIAFLDERDGAVVRDGEGALALPFLMLVLLTDGSNELDDSIIGYTIIFHGAFGTRFCCRWRLTGLKTTGTSSTHVEVYGIDFGARDYLPAYALFVRMMGPAKARVFTDSTSALISVRKGCSKSMGFIAGENEILGRTAPQAANKAYQCRLSWLCKVLGDVSGWTTSESMSGDGLTKPLGDDAFLYHEWASFQMTRDEEDLKRPRCECYRCVSAWGFARSRCINLVQQGRFCDLCTEKCVISDDEADSKQRPPCECHCLNPPWRFGKTGTTVPEPVDSNCRAAVAVVMLLLGAGAKVTSASGNGQQQDSDMRKVTESSGQGRPPPKRVPSSGHRGPGGPGDKGDGNGGDDSDDDLAERMKKIQVKDTKRRISVWCDHMDWHTDSEDESVTKFRRCRLAPHHLKHEGCPRCHLHCGKPNGDSKKQRKKRGVRRGPAQKNWIYDPLTGEKL
jgi:hypothetical protein